MTDTLLLDSDIILRQYLLAGLIDGDGHWKVMDTSKNYEICAKENATIRAYKRLCTGLGMKVGKIMDTETENEETGEAYQCFRISFSGLSIPDVDDKLACTYKRPARYTRTYAEGTWSFTIEPETVNGMELDLHFVNITTTDGDNEFLLADSTRVHGS